MVLSIDAEQERRSKLAHLRPVTLVTITITDPSTVVYRFSQGTRAYGGNEYLGYLVGLSGIMQSMLHLENKPLADTVTIRLQNRPYGTGTLLDEFLGKTIENAQVKIEQLLLGDSESRDVPTSTGAVTRFLGRVLRVVKIQDTDFGLECIDERVVLDDLVNWRVVAEADPAPPREYGKRLPKPYGAGVVLPCVAWDIGALTTLAEDLTSAQTGARKFTDVSKFPSGSFDAMLGAERIGFTAKSDANNTLTIGTRGKAGGSAAVAHKTGETIVELQTNNYWIAGEGADLKSINDVYMLSPSTGELVKVTDFVNTLNVANATLVSGRTVASILIKDTGIESIKQLDNMLQQPAFGGLQNFPFDEDFSIQTFGSAKLRWDNPMGLPVVVGDSSKPTGTTSGLFRYVVFGKSTTIEVSRFRVGFVAQITGILVSAAENETIAVKVTGPSGETATATATILYNTANEGATLNNQSSWVTVSNQPKTLNSFVNAAKSGTNKTLRFEPTIGSQFVTDGAKISFLSLLIEFDTSGGLSQDAASFAGGFGLQLFANVDGYKVPAGDATYSVSAGTLIERDYDTARHVLKKQLTAGAPAQTLASNWNTQGALEQTNSEHAFDARVLGTKLTEILNRLANESRCNITLAGGVWKFLRRRSSPPGYTTVAPEFKRANLLAPFDASVKGLEDIANTLSAWYDFDPAARGRDEEQFKGRVVSASAASVTKYGTRELEPFRFLTIRANAVAQATLDEMLQELKDRRYGVMFQAPHWVAYLLELGDVPTALMPFLTSAIGVRILEIAPNLQDESYTIKAWQVPTS